LHHVETEHFLLSSGPELGLRFDYKLGLTTFEFRILVSSSVRSNWGADCIQISTELKMKELEIRGEPSRGEAQNAGIRS